MGQDQMFNLSIQPVLIGTVHRYTITRMHIRNDAHVHRCTNAPMHRYTGPPIHQCNDAIFNVHQEMWPPSKPIEHSVVRLNSVTLPGMGKLNLIVEVPKLVWDEQIKESARQSGALPNETLDALSAELEIARAKLPPAPGDDRRAKLGDTHIVGIHLPLTLWYGLLEFCQVTHATRSQVIRDALADYLYGRESDRPIGR